MRIGVPKEIKDNEARVGLIPSSVAELVHHGHHVMLEAGAGDGAGLTDRDYRDAGADIIPGPDRIFAEAEMVMKVKEPLASERRLLRPGQILFTYLHLAPDLAQTEDLVASNAVCIAYEPVVSRRRSGRTTSRRRRAGVAFCSGAYQAFRPPRSWFLAEACPGRMRRPSRSAWEQGSRWSTDPPRSSSASRRSSAPP